MSVNLMQQLNTISNPGGIGIPVTTYTSEMQKALQLQLTTVPNNELTALSSQQSALQALQTALQSFQSATNTLASSQNWNTVTATSSDPTNFTVTASPGAQASNYNVTVAALSTYDTWMAGTSTSWQTTDSGSSTLAAGTLTITPTTLNSGKPVNISITAGESLNSIVSDVNNQTTTTGVQAQLIYNGSTYQLSLSAAQSGSNYNFSATDTSSSGSQFGFSESQKGQNASLTIDGVSVSSATNTFTNAIPNVTINALQTTATGVTNTINISPDASSTTKAVQTWMSAYNSVIDILKKDTAYTPASSANNTPGTSGPLFSDSNANSLLSSLPMTAMQSVSNTVQSSMSSLATIGIVEDPSTGHLEFQPSGGFTSTGSSISLPDGQTTFQNAVTNSVSAVQALFGVVSNNSASSAIATKGVLGNLTNQLNTYLTGSGGQSGLIQTDLTSISNQQANIQSSLTQINQQITDQVNNFTQQLNNLNAAMQKAQFQMQQMSALLGSSSSSTSSSSSSTSTSTGG